MAKNFTIVPSASQLLIEKIFLFLYESIFQQLLNEGQRFFGLLVTTFIFIFFFNLSGMVAFTCSVTSQMAVNFTLSFSLFIAVTLIGVQKHGFNFIKLFFPKGVPNLLIPLLFLIEVISYFSRAISLGIRLFANIMAGHTLLVILTSFATGLGKFSLLAGFFPFLVVFGVTFLEIAISCLQAYVFFVLVIIYFKDAIYLH